MRFCGAGQHRYRIIRRAVAKLAENRVPNLNGENISAPRLLN
ncbi:hypothetical protein FRUB_08353 [Fimbriiglobus ruber]|uniref:Uncharacterized protein n=1 Tax=Fimbriiglobus ruber TaxID=1908690 RepID=A0A225D2H0_9BACT|nr:hypothetical protein FRUB_08353 [Fimbriiglobus ruber]